MQLKPKLPPGHASRKALRYGHEVRRLRAEGHTFEAIREALLDVGVSVSLSTVRREAVHPPSKWELEHMEEASLAREELPPSPEATATAQRPQQFGAGSGQSAGPTGSESGLANIEAVGDHPSVGLLSRVIGVLRRLRRSQ